MGICRIGSDGRINRLLFFNLGLVLRHLWKRWVLSAGKCVFALLFGWHSNELFGAGHFLSTIFLSSFHSNFFFLSSFNLLLLDLVLKKICSKIFYTYNFSLACIYIYWNDSLGWRKKKSRDFVNTEQKGAAKLLVQVLPPLVLWLFLIIS